MLDFKFSCVFHLPISSPLLTVYDLISILYCSPKLPLASCRCSHGYKPLPPPQGVHLFYSALLFLLRRFIFIIRVGGELPHCPRQCNICEQSACDFTEYLSTDIIYLFLLIILFCSV